MSHSHRKQLVNTVKDLCRVCYTCVRECPVKAIRIINGQAEVISERCIGCGNCTIVCSQGAKSFLRTWHDARALVASHPNVIALVAPSFPAEFSEIQDYRRLVGMIRALGFSKVCEVAFGADMVARRYQQYRKDNGCGLISSDCPAIVFFIEHYHPELVPYLAPVVSPMVAMTRIVRKKYGDDSRVIFIGPCIAKKAESDEIDEAITFSELRAWFREAGITPEKVEPTPFDPPRAGKGAVFPISRGLLQTAGMSEDLMHENVVVASGRVNFREAIKEFEASAEKNQYLELLCCDGCITGPGTSPGGRYYQRKALVSRYVRQKMSEFSEEEWNMAVEEFSDVDLSQQHQVLDRRLAIPDEETIQKVLAELGKVKPEDHLNCTACGYDTCREHAIAIIQGLAEAEMCLPLTIEKLHRTITELNESNRKLASTQQALRQSEKLASMGQLSAGIAHELNNPLGIITMYSNILLDELPEDNPIRNDIQLIAQQAERCKKIVGGLLNFARKNQVVLSEVNLSELIQQSLQSVIKPDSVKVVVEDQLKNPLIYLDPDQMLQALINLEKNAVEAMPSGGVLSVKLYENEKYVHIEIADTGTGIAREHLEHLFTPFFTTKAIGKGTGLGLPMVYGVIKMHRGKIEVETNADPAAGPTGTTFRIAIPRDLNQY